MCSTNISQGVFWELFVAFSKKNNQMYNMLIEKNDSEIDNKVLQID